MSISIHYILIWCFQKCIFSRGEECKCRKKSSHNVHLLVLVHNISRLYVEVGDHNLVLAPTSILAVIYSSELEKVSLDFWSGVVVFLIRHHHVTFKSSELERYAKDRHAALLHKDLNLSIRSAACGIQDDPACLGSDLLVGGLLADELDERTDGTGINHSLDLADGTSGDVGQSPARLLLDLAIAVGDELLEAGDGVALQNDLGVVRGRGRSAGIRDLRIVGTLGTNDIANGPQSWLGHPPAGMKEELDKAWHQPTGRSLDVGRGRNDGGNVRRRSVAQMAERPAGITQNFGIGTVEKTPKSREELADINLVGAGIIAPVAVVVGIVVGTLAILSSGRLLELTLHEGRQGPGTDPLQAQVGGVELHASKQRGHDTGGQHNIPSGHVLALLVGVVRYGTSDGPVLTRGGGISGGDGTQYPQSLLVDLAVGAGQQTDEGGDGIGMTQEEMLTGRAEGRGDDVEAGGRRRAGIARQSGQTGEGGRSRRHARDGRAGGHQAGTREDGGGAGEEGARWGRRQGIGGGSRGVGGIIRRSCSCSCGSGIGISSTATAATLALLLLLSRQHGRRQFTRGRGRAGVRRWGSTGSSTRCSTVGRGSTCSTIGSSSTSSTSSSPRGREASRRTWEAVVRAGVGWVGRQSRRRRGRGTCSITSSRPRRNAQRLSRLGRVGRTVLGNVGQGQQGLDLNGRPIVQVEPSQQGRDPILLLRHPEEVGPMDGQDVAQPSGGGQLQFTNGIGQRLLRHAVGTGRGGG